MGARQDEASTEAEAPCAPSPPHHACLPASSSAGPSSTSSGGAAAGRSAAAAPAAQSAAQEEEEVAEPASKRRRGGHEEEGITLIVLALSGASKRFEDISPTCTVAQLAETVLQEFSPGTLHELQDIGKLCHGTRELDQPARTLQDLGFRGEVTLSYVQTQHLITLETKDSGTVKVAQDFACMAKTVQKAVDEHGPEQVVPVTEVSAKSLKQVMRYCTYHWGSPAGEIIKPLPSTNLRECGVCEWDCDFVDVPQDELFEIILAANKMEIQPLLDLACAKVASMIKGKNTEEIRKQFNIVNDFTPEEEAQVREENRWCEDA